MDTSTKAIADHIAGLRAMSHGMGDYDADAMQALLDDRDDWVKAANLALQEKLAAEAERNALRQQLHDARDKALEEAASLVASRERSCSDWFMEIREHANVYDQLSAAVSDIRALKGAKQ